MSYLDEYEKEEDELLSMSDEDFMKAMLIRDSRDCLRNCSKEMEFDEKKDIILQNAINASHLLFINENKKDLCEFHNRAAICASNIKQRDLFACHLGLYCVVNSIECFGQVHGEVMGRLPFGKTVYYEKPEEKVRIIKTSMELLALKESTKTIPSFIHCPTARTVLDILDWALTPSLSDDSFWKLFE